MFKAATIFHHSCLNMETRIALFQQVLRRQVPAAEESLGAPVCMLYWACERLSRLVVMKPLILLGVMIRLHEPLTTFAKDYMESISAGLDRPTFTVAIADERYMTWTGHHGWLDLTSMQDVPQLQRSTEESLAYNLGETFRKNRTRCQAVEREYAAGSTPEQAEVS